MTSRYDELSGPQKRAWQQLEGYRAGPMVEAYDGHEPSVAFASAWPAPESWAIDCDDPSQVVWLIPGDMEPHSSLELVEGDWLRPQAGRAESRRVRTVRQGYGS